MAETSRSRVTITLGRTGQVVKRAGQVGNSGSSYSHPAVRSKRSVRDRLGSDVDGIQLNNKRQRGDRNKLMMNDGNGLDDRLGKHDLRFKLMQKNVARQVESDPRNGVDLRETLSRAVRPSAKSGSMRQHPPKRADSRHFVPEQKDAGMLGRIPSMRSAEAFLQMDSLRNSYSPWTLDSLRQRSPDRVVRTSRNLSPPRNGEQVGKRPLIRAYDVARAGTVSWMSRDTLEPRRQVGTAPYMTRPSVPAASLMPVAPVPAQPPPPSGIVQKGSYTVQGSEHLTVDGLLHSLGLEKYAIYFKAEEVDMTALKQMGDNDLKDLGIPMGPRKKIQLALLPRSKR